MDLDGLSLPPKNTGSMEPVSRVEEVYPIVGSSSLVLEAGAVQPKTPRKRRGSEPADENPDMVPPIVAAVDQRIPITLEEHVDMVLNIKKAEFICQDPTCRKVFKDVEEYTDHYTRRHMYKCAECRKSLPGSHFLELHVLENHDTLFALMASRKPMYACLAEECPQKFNTADERYEHFHFHHKKHPLFVTFKHFENISGNKQKGHQKGRQGLKGKKGPSHSSTVGSEPEHTVSMETDNDVVANGSEQVEKKSPKSSKPKVSIQFGHSAAKFKSWHSGPKVNLSSEKIMDMADIENVLENVDAVESEITTDVVVGTCSQKYELENGNIDVPLEVDFK